MADQQEKERARRAFQKALCAVVADHLERGGVQAQTQILAVLTAETVRGCAESGIPLEELICGVRELYALVAFARKADEGEAP